MAVEAAPTWRRLLEKLDGDRADWEYPFAVAGLNTAFMLLEVTGVQKGMTSPSRAQGGGGHQRAAVAYASLAEADDRAFEQLFVASFEALDREWLKQRASYMQFNAVLSAVRSQVDRALSSRPRGIPEFRRQLGLGSG